MQPSIARTVLEVESITQDGKIASPMKRIRRPPRDKIYMFKDIIERLAGTGEMNKSMLLSVCGLNSKIHESVLNDLEERKFVRKRATMNGAKEISLYDITHEGLHFCRTILQPFEEIFPRKAREQDDNECWV